jgi:hypothetical protein
MADCPLHGKISARMKFSDVGLETVFCSLGLGFVGLGLDLGREQVSQCQSQKQFKIHDSNGYDPNESRKAERD